jgi:hypothetical protein
MSHAPLDLAGWRLRIDARTTTALPSAALAPGQPTSIALPAGGLSDSGGVCMLVNPADLSVHCVAYPGGDPAAGWSSTLA